MTSSVSSSANPSSATLGFRLLVFDWDGTVMDSLGSIVACTQKSLADLGLDRHSDSRIRTVIGLGLRETFEELFPEIDDAMRQKVVERYRHHWFAGFRDASIAIEGAAKTLERLAEREYWLAVATGKGRPGLERDLDATDMRRFFLATRTAHDAPSKPNPQMLLEILDELGVAPQDTLMIGDTTYDLDMAAAAGCASVGVLTGGHDRSTLLRSGPLTCLESVVELPGWLEKSYPSSQG